MASRSLSSLRRWFLSSPPAEWTINMLREMLIGAIKQGRVPRHVAFVMDGNRRYARRNRIETVEGHNLGFEALARILEVCYKSGVTHVTIYAFSIENFKRSRHEVDALMDMAKIKLTQLSQHGELLDRYGARIRVLGQRELLKPDVLEAIDRACKMTEHNDRTVLNVCFPYTSRDEITTAIRRTVSEYSRPLSGSDSHANRKNHFTEERIANTLRSQQDSHLDAILESVPEQEQDHEPPSSKPHPKQLGSPFSSTTSLSAHSTSDLALDNTTSTPPEETMTTRSSPPSSYTSSPPINPSKFHTPKTTTSHKPPFTEPQSPFPPADSITAATITKNTFTSDDPPLDLLVRTSGVERLSDFMLWQAHEDTRIVFLDVLWPEFDLWSFLPVLWEWQWRARKEGALAGVEE